MTDIDNVSKKILEDAEQQKQKIIGETQQKASQVLAETEEKIQKNLVFAQQEAEQRYSQTLDLEILKAKSSLDQKLLLAKLQLTDGILVKAKDKLSEADPKTYLAYIRKNLAQLNISQGAYIIGSREENISSKDIEGLASGLKPAGQEPDFEYGVKIISKNTEYLISPQSTIDSRADDLKMEIADFLFKKES